jgi:CubicO group peptidase (beta-lactamase class C family)
MPAALPTPSLERAVMTDTQPRDVMALARPEDVGMSREKLALIGERLGEEISAGRLPGAVTLVARRGRVVHFKAAGRLDPAGEAAMERDALFRIYSMTKPIVSVAVMGLVEEGRLLLSDPLSQFLPDFADMLVLEDGASAPVAAERPITIQDLLRHTSGLSYEWVGSGPVQTAYVDAKLGSRRISAAEQSAALAAIPLARQPGTAWHYSRATDVLGHLIEVVAGDSLGRVLARRIFEPLGMVDTHFALPVEKLARLAQPFATDPDSGEAVSLTEPAKPSRFESGGGGLVSTAGDYARFLHALASGGSLEGARVLAARRSST